MFTRVLFECKLYDEVYRRYLFYGGEGGGLQLDDGGPEERGHPRYHPPFLGGVEWFDGRGGEQILQPLFFSGASPFLKQVVDHQDPSTLVCYLFASVFIYIYILDIFWSDSDMAKGEGGEQYSNASLLSKQPSSDDIKIAKKVGSFILFFYRG